jgi:hypothetical protein
MVLLYKIVWLLYSVGKDGIYIIGFPTHLNLTARHRLHLITLCTKS